MAAPAGNMDARRYSVTELLSMRFGLGVLHFTLSRLNPHPSLRSIIRLPMEVFAHPHITRRTTFLLKSAQKQKLQLQASSSENTRRFSSEISENPENHAKMLQNQDQPRVWKLRGRDSSETNSQPYSAPTDFDTQESENFKRFYKAVVSPSHVRVTAGGRIVPNTRNAAPPKFNWNPEKMFFEPAKQYAESDSTTLQGTPSLSGAPWVYSTPSVPPGFSPMVAGVFPPPFPFMQPGNALPMHMAHMASQPFAGAIGYDQIPHSGAHMNLNGDATTPVAQSGPFTQPVKLSPPGQFDQSKPFIVNGQTVYPMPAGFQPPPNVLAMPLAMVGSPSFSPPMPAPPPGMVPMHAPMAMSPFQMPLSAPNGHHFPMMAPPPVPVPSVMPGMVLVSDFTKNQIEGFRGHLKMVEGQIQILKNQHMDVSYLETQRDYYTTTIRQMEEILKTQLALEAGMNNKIAPKIATSPVRKSASGSGDAKSKKDLKSGGEIAAVETPKLPTPPIQPVFAKQEIEGGEDAVGTTTASGAETGSVPKSKLTAAAAMAPPFQPRSQVLASGQGNSITDDVVSLPRKVESMEDIELRLISKATTDWADTSIPALFALSMPKAKSMYNPPTQSMLDSPPKLQRFSTETATLTPLDNLPVTASNTMPYLVGTLPYGINPSQVKSADIIYPRALTEDEISARRLYWGNAPKSVHVGLPKFDGKDFYPPSPVKKSARFSNYSAGMLPSPKSGSPAADINFTTFYNEARSRGIRISAPLRHAASFNDFGSSSQSRTASPAGNFNFTSTLTRPSRADTPDADFSKLFHERGVSGYKSPVPERRFGSGFSDNGDEPSTPNRLYSGIEPLSEVHDKPISTNGVVSDHGSTGNTEVRSATSTDEIYATPKVHATTYGTSFAERIANVSSSQQQNLFLQSILRKAAQSPQPSPAIPVMVSSAHAHGYLPQYRGFAAASLAPTISNASTSDHGFEAATGMTKESAIASPAVVSSTLPENRPLRRSTRNIGDIRTDGMDAQDYMRYLAKKDDEGRTAAEQG